MIVFDLTDRESYEGIDVWRNNFLESINASAYVNGRSISGEQDSEVAAPIILVGNKVDLGKSKGR